MNDQMTLVISSPSSSTIGFCTLILAMFGPWVSTLGGGGRCYRPRAAGPSAVPAGLPAVRDEHRGPAAGEGDAGDPTGRGRRLERAEVDEQRAAVAGDARADDRLVAEGDRPSPAGGHAHGPRGAGVLPLE